MRRQASITKSLKTGQGAITIMTQSCFVRTRVLEDIRLDECLMPLRFLQRGTSECTLRALQDTLPEFSVPSIVAMMPTTFAVGHVSSMDSAGYKLAWLLPSLMV